MKTLTLFILLACCFGATAQSKTPMGAWMPVNTKWQNAPADVEPNLSTTSTRVLYFQPDGKMNVIGCIVYRRFGHYTISAGDGQTVSVGDWHEEHDRIITHSRLAYRSVPKIGEALPGPWFTEVMVLKRGKLGLKGVLYRRVPDLDRGAEELMPRSGPS